MGTDIGIAALLLISSGAVLVVIGRKQSSGTLDRNWLAGVRTSQTMRSDAAWHAAHRGTAGLISGAGVVPLVAGAAILLLRPTDDATIATIVLASLGVTLALALMAGFRGHRIAREVNERGGEEETNEDV